MGQTKPSPTSAGKPYLFLRYSEFVPIVFSDHAKQQLKRRKITQRLVKEAVYKSTGISKSFKGRKLRRLQVGDKLLEK